MENESDKKLDELKERLATGEYAIDPRAVADAILRRSRDVAVLRAELRAVGQLDLHEPRPARWAELPQTGPERSTEAPRTGPERRAQGRPAGPHSVCSYPSSRLVASRKRAPGRPSLARPIQLIRAVGSAFRTAASATAAAYGGAQAQSS